MGLPAPNGSDKAQSVLQGALSANGSSAAIELQRRFNAWFFGAFVARVYLERSFDGGQTWFFFDPSAEGRNASSSMSLIYDEPEAGILYRVTVSNYQSGTINYRLSQ